MRTNGQRGTPSREQIQQEASYYAAVYGNYDTSEVAQQAGLLTITVLDASRRGQEKPPGATHRFYVEICRTAYFVTRYRNRYEVEPADVNEDQQQEQSLREAVLDTALSHLTGARYQRGTSSQEDKERFIAKLLGKGADHEAREECDPVRHPVVRDELPSMTIPNDAGLNDDTAPLVLRQWCVEVGAHHCHVGLIGYDEDGGPELVACGQSHDDNEEEM